MSLPDEQHGERPARGTGFFSAPADAPRIRWRTDLISAGLFLAVLIFLAIVAGEGSEFDLNTLEFVGTLPHWVLWLAQFVYVVGVLYTFSLLVGVGVLARGRTDLLRDMLAAAALSLAVVFLLTRFIDERWPELAFWEYDDIATTFPAVFITTGAAIQAAASPHLTAPVRKVGWTLVLTGSLGALVGAVHEVSDALGGLLVGLFSAAIIRFAFGTTAGLPSTDSLKIDFGRLGVDVADLRYRDEQPIGSVVLDGTSTGGTQLFVRGIGRDSWHTRRSTLMWHRAWYHTEGEQHGSNRREHVEHQALSLLLASRAGVSVPAVIAVGITDRDDAIIITERIDTTLRDLPAEQLDDSLLDAVWVQVSALHEAGLSNGRLALSDVWIDPVGAPVLSGFSESAINATADQRNGDVASMLVSTSLIVGTDRAVRAARRALGDEALADMLPMLQAATLSPAQRHEAKHHKLKIADLRKQTAAAVGVDLPAIEQLQRVTVVGALSTVLAGVAVYTVVTGLADVGLDTIVDTLSDARWALVILALVLTQATNLTDAISAVAASPKRVPIGLTTIEQLAISYVKLVTPSNTGQIATNARFFGKFGMSAVTAMTVGAITGIVAFVAQILLVTLSILVGEASVDLSTLEADGSMLRLLAFAIVLLIVALVAVLLVAPWRRWMGAKIREPFAQVKDAISTLRHPRRAALTLGGAVGTEILYGAGLALCVFAVGGSIGLGEAIFINVAVSLFASLMPVPGGVGVYEAGAVAGLMAFGVDNDIAVSAVLVYRLCSFYLPPIWGFASLRWLRTHDYL